MNNFLSAVCLVLVSLPMSAQINWVNSYTYGFSVDPRDFILDNDGHILVGGFFLDDNQQRNVKLLRVDEMTGDSLSFSNCQGPGECDSRGDILKLNFLNENIYSSGGLTIGQGDYIAKLNSDYDLSYEWLVSDLFSMIHHITQLIPVEDGLVALGEFSISEYAILKFNLEGTIVWSQSIPVSEIGREPQGALMSNGNIAFFYRDGLNQGVDYLVFIDAQGEIVNTTELKGINVGSAANSTNEIISTELIIDDQLEQEYVIAKYLEDGTRTILSDGISELEFPKLIRSDSNGDIFIALDIIDENRKEGIKISKYSSSGQILSSINYFDDSQDVNFAQMKLSHDESQLILMGQLGRNSTLLLSVDARFSVATKDLSYDLELDLYPNPVNDILHIHINTANETSSLYFSIYDTIGRQIKHGSLEQNQNSLDLTMLKAGLYTVSITNDQLKIRSKIIMKN